MSEFTQECEIGQYFRKWMMSVDSVADVCNNRVIDSIPEDSECRNPFIYFSMEDAEETDALCGGFDDFDFVVEVCGPERGLPAVRKVKMNLLFACQAYQRGQAFGDPDYNIQSLEIIKVRDGYQSMMAAYIPALVYSIFAVRITP